MRGNNKNKQCIDRENLIGKKVHFIYNDIEGDIEIVKYKDEYLYVKYLEGKEFKIKLCHFLNCHLGKLLGEHTGNFKIEIGTHFKDEKRNIVITDRKYVIDSGNIKRKYYKYICNKCNYDCGEHYKSGEYKEEHWSEESSLLDNTGCACCCNRIVVPEINSIVANKETHWMIPYFQGGYDEAKKYSKSNSKIIYFKCPDCGRIKDKKMIINTLYCMRSVGCSCGDGFSYPTKIIFSILKQLHIENQTEYSPNWIKPKRYDFYIPSKKIIIEVDGEFHRKDNEMNGQTKQESQAIDEYKDEMAKKHGIKVIRINYEFGDLDFINNSILKSELNDIFDLSKVDWLKCEEFALSNLCKKACEIKRDSLNISTKNIAKIMNLSINTIIRYLSKGTRLGWCYYNSHEEHSRLNGCPVEIFKDGISLGIFPSCAELSRKSKELFGIKLNNSSISLVASGKQKSPYKGFIFKYINEEGCEE